MPRSHSRPRSSSRGRPAKRRRASSVASSANTSTSESPHENAKQVRTTTTIFDAVAGRITTHGISTAPSNNNPSYYRDTLSHSMKPLTPAEALSSTKDAPDIFEDENPYDLHRHLVPTEAEAHGVRRWIRDTAARENDEGNKEDADTVKRMLKDVRVGKLPDGDLLKAIHGFASQYYTARGVRGDFRSLDETALLAFGILLEESIKSALGNDGWMEFVKDEVRPAKHTRRTKKTKISKKEKASVTVNVGVQPLGEEEMSQSGKAGADTTEHDQYGDIVSSDVDVKMESQSEALGASSHEALEVSNDDDEDFNAEDAGDVEDALPNTAVGSRIRSSYGMFGASRRRKSPSTNTNATSSSGEEDSDHAPEPPKAVHSTRSSRRSGEPPPPAPVNSKPARTPLRRPKYRGSDDGNSDYEGGSIAEKVPSPTPRTRRRSRRAATIEAYGEDF